MGWFYTSGLAQDSGSVLDTASVFTDALLALPVLCIIAVTVGAVGWTGRRAAAGGEMHCQTMGHPGGSASADRGGAAGGGAVPPLEGAGRRGRGALAFWGRRPAFADRVIGSGCGKRCERGVLRAVGVGCGTVVAATVPQMLMGLANRAGIDIRVLHLSVLRKLGMRLPGELGGDPGELGGDEPGGPDGSSHGAGPEAAESHGGGIAAAVGESVTPQQPAAQGLDLGTSEIAVALLSGLAAVVVAAAAVRAARRSRSGNAADARATGRMARRPLDGDGEGECDGGFRNGWLRLAAGLGILGAGIAVPPALLVSLSEHMQTHPYLTGRAYRETLLTQVGCSLIAAAAIAALLGAVQSARRSTAATKTAAMAAAAILGAGCISTLIANGQLAHIDRSSASASINNQISEQTIRFDESASGNGYRCGLLDSLALLQDDEEFERFVSQMRRELDSLALDRYGRPFCVV